MCEVIELSRPPGTYPDNPTPKEQAACDALLRDKLTAYEIGRAMHGGGALGPEVLRGLTDTQIWYCMNNWQKYLDAGETARIDESRSRDERNYNATQRVLRAEIPRAFSRKGGSHPKRDPSVTAAIRDYHAKHPNKKATEIARALQLRDNLNHVTPRMVRGVIGPKKKRQ